MTEEENKRKRVLRKWVAKPPEEPERKIEEIRSKPAEEPRPKKSKESQSE